MSTNQSDTTTEEEETEAIDPLADLAEEVAAALDADVSTDFRTLKARIPSERWVDTAVKARDDLGLPFFSWLSATDWANDVEVGDELSEPTEERFEILCELSDVSEGRFVVLSTDISKENPTLPSLVETFPGANWHEREAAEMFGITFEGHPNPVALYLPNEFEGHPLLKSFPLLTREVKPWPGKVDVEDMPAEENVEAGDEAESSEEEEGA